MNVPPNPPVLVCAFANTIHGLDCATGQTRWSAQPFGDSLGGTEVEIAITDGVVIAVTEANIAFIDYNTGHVHVAMGLPDGPARRPTMIVEGAHLYISRHGTVTCYTLRGQLVWSREIPCVDYSSMALGVPGNVRQADDPGSR